MVSEYTLQQTPLSRVLPKWIEWMDRWATPADLAKATPAPISKEKADRQKLVPTKDAHIWTAATMELGAVICTSKNPKCELCQVIA